MTLSGELTGVDLKAQLSKLGISGSGSFKVGLGYGGTASPTEQSIIVVEGVGGEISVGINSLELVQALHSIITGE